MLECCQDIATRLLKFSGWMIVWVIALPTQLKRAHPHRSQQAACCEASFTSVASTGRATWQSSIINGKKEKENTCKAVK